MNKRRRCDTCKRPRMPHQTRTWQCRTCGQEVIDAKAKMKAMGWVPCVFDTWDRPSPPLEMTAAVWRVPFQIVDGSTFLPSIPGWAVTLLRMRGGYVGSDLGHRINTLFSRLHQEPDLGLVLESAMVMDGVDGIWVRLQKHLAEAA